MTTTATKLSPAISRFLAAHAVGPVERRSQSVMFAFANGRTGYIMFTEDGRFRAAMAYRGDSCLGHYSTLKLFGAVAG